MQSELAIQKLNELREVVDGEMEEMVDSMATIAILKQELSNPMFGAKVTFHEKPEGEWVEVSYEYYRDKVDNGEMLPHSPDEGWDVVRDSDNTTFNRREHEPWWLQWYYNSDTGHSFERYFSYGEKQKIERDEVPSSLSPDNELDEDIELAREMEDEADIDDKWHGEWMIYEKDFREYRFTPLLPATELESIRAIVFEPMVAEAPEGKYWDPNKEEYTTPDDYPMGTVNLIIPDAGYEFGEGYVSKTQDRTSVAPANGEPSPYSYTPGWSED